jgi:hypothetical protein
MTPSRLLFPYMAAYGNITKALDKIKTAATPDRFSQDFLEKTLGMTGGGNRPVLHSSNERGSSTKTERPPTFTRNFGIQIGVVAPERER